MMGVRQPCGRGLASGVNGFQNITKHLLVKPRGFVDGDVADVDATLEVDVFQHAMESWPARDRATHAIGDIKIDHPGNVAAGRRGVHRIKRHNQFYRDPKGAQSIGHVDSRVSSQRVTNDDDGAFLTRLVVAGRLVGKRFIFGMVVNRGDDSLGADLRGQLVHATLRRGLRVPIYEHVLHECHAA